MTAVSLKLLVLKTHRMSDLVRFYESLGLKFESEQHGKGPIHFSSSLGDGILEIYPLPDAADVETMTRLGFSIADPDKVISQVQEFGGAIVKPGRETTRGYMAIAKDPDGRTVELYRKQP